MDIVIIGGGPCGMTLAWLLSKNNFNITLIDKNSSLGGCHRVSRQNKLFSEHGPRVYMNNFKNFRWILNDLGMDFNKLFVQLKCKDRISVFLKQLNISEIYSFIKVFITLNNSHKQITVKEWLDKNSFRENIVNEIDYICRTVDGAGIDRFVLYNFIQIINYGFFYKVFQPNKPNDKGFIKKWESKLKKNKVKIIKNAIITKINIVGKNIYSVFGNNIEYKADRYIMAIPPEQIAQLLNNNTFTKWSSLTNYYETLSITFHWNKKNVFIENCDYLYNNNKYGIIFIVLSDYMKFDGTVISTIISRYNKNKSIEQYKEIIYSFLKSFNNNLPIYDNAIVAPYDTSFITTKYGYIPNETIYSNLYNCGTHNGNSDYPLTTIETAITNAIFLSNKFTKKKYTIYRIFTLYQLILTCILLLIFYLK